MKVLVGCEFSGTVREAFRKLGHDAYSCDLLASDDDSEHHYQCDINELLTKDHAWDLIILHPPCTALAVSGNRWYGENMEKHQQRVEAVRWTFDLWNRAMAVCDRVALENPVGVLPRLANMYPSQYVQPYQFGHPESKKTGLWLHNLPPLEETDNVKAEYDSLPVNEAQRLFYLPRSDQRWKIRSKTFSGIAEAMAQQWGGHSA